MINYLLYDLNFKGQLVLLIKYHWVTWPSSLPPLLWFIIRMDTFFGGRLFSGILSVGALNRAFWPPEHCVYSVWVGGCSHLVRLGGQPPFHLSSAAFFWGGALTFTMRTSFEFTTRTLLSSEYFANAQLMLRRCRHSCIKWEILALSAT